jgi:hypothetical protein
MLESMDSLDTVELVMRIEGLLETEVPDQAAERLSNPGEMVDWLELHLSNRRPSRQAAAYLKELARKYNPLELAEGLSGCWRREQIAAIARDLLRS